MNKKLTITKEEIISNEKLDLNEKINELNLKFPNYSEEEIKDFAISLIRQEYEFFANKREIISPRTDYLLEKIKSGHTLDRTETLEMFCDDEERINIHRKFETIRKNIKENNAVTRDDLEYLLNEGGYNESEKELIRMSFEARGLIIDSYKDEETNKKNI